MAPKKDFTQVAFAVVQAATGEARPAKVSAKQQAGQKGGAKGGKARMGALTDAEKHQLAMLGVKGRRKDAPEPQSGAPRSTKKIG